MEFDDPLFWIGDQPNFQDPFETIYLTSTIPGSLQQNHPTAIKVGNQSFPIQKGMQLFYQNGRDYEIENYAIADASIAQEFINRLEALNKRKTYFMLVAHNMDTVFRDHEKQQLSRLGFNELAALKKNEGYIGYTLEGFVNEYRTIYTLSMTLPKSPQTRRPSYQIQNDARNPKRFIAHAGGKIEGYTYTNSLEAMNLSYKKGFRLFELDILKTSDGHYVAAHNWEEWAKKANFKGTLPPSKTDF